MKSAVRIVLTSSLAIAVVVLAIRAFDRSFGGVPEGCAERPAPAREETLRLRGVDAPPPAPPASGAPPETAPVEATDTDESPVPQGAPALRYFERDAIEMTRRVRAVLASRGVEAGAGLDARLDALRVDLAGALRDLEEAHLGRIDAAGHRRYAAVRRRVLDRVEALLAGWRLDDAGLRSAIAVSYGLRTEPPALPPDGPPDAVTPVVVVTSPVGR